MSRASLRRADEDARRLGLLVARNVEKGTRGGDNGNQHTGGIPQSRNGKVSCERFATDSGTGGNPSVPRGTDDGKVSARQFANTSGTSADRVLEAATRPP